MRLLICFPLLIFYIGCYSQLEIVNKPYQHIFVQVSPIMVLRYISSNNNIIRIDTFRKNEKLWVYHDNIRKKIEIGEKFKRNILRDFIYGIKVSKMSYVKTGNWYYINYSKENIKLKKRYYSRFKKHAMSDLYYF